MNRHLSSYGSRNGVMEIGDIWQTEQNKTKRTSSWFLLKRILISFFLKIRQMCGTVVTTSDIFQLALFDHSNNHPVYGTYLSSENSSTLNGSSIISLQQKDVEKWSLNGHNEFSSYKTSIQMLRNVWNSLDSYHISINIKELVENIKGKIVNCIMKCWGLASMPVWTSKASPRSRQIER